MSRIEVANALKVTQAHYSRIENGKRIPDALQILELCKIFNCTPNDLFGICGVHTVGGYEFINPPKE